MKIIDISLPLSGQVPIWPGNAGYGLEPVKRMASGDSSNVSKLVIGTHTGTHVDAPRHFLDSGTDVAGLALTDLLGPCTVAEIPAPSGRVSLGAPAIERAAGSPVPRRLLLKTPNSRLWAGEGFSPDFASVSPEAAQWLVTNGVRLVGIDYLSIEAFKNPGAPTHHILLGAGVIIVEGLNLADVAPGAYELVCLPLPLVGSDGAPARVILVEHEK
jgi:arylformamidase